MFDRFEWSLFLSIAVAVLGAIGVWFAAGVWEAAVITAFVALFVLALTYDYERDVPAQKTVVVEPVAEAQKGSGLVDAAAIINAIADPTLLVSGGRILAANEAAKQLLGSHIMGRDIRMAIRHPAAAQHIAGATGPATVMETDLVGLGTHDQSWRLRIAPLGDDKQVVTLSDQSNRQAAEQMRVDFVANASHELRTPLSGILGFIETLTDPVAGDDRETRGRFLRIMEGEARRMQRLVEDLMSLSRIEADKYRSPDQPVDMVSLIKEVADVMGRQHGGRGFDIIMDVIDESPVRGDRAQLSQLLHNLVGNAMKYGRPGTPVTIALDKGRGSLLRLSVKDEGDGIAPEHLPRLTERFYRIDSGRSRALGGTGLGLAIVKHIVERHRGQMTIDSIIGKGTTITVDLPVFETVSDSAAPPAPGALSSK